MNDYPIKTPKQLASVLQGYRRERGLTQTDVGAKVGLAQKAVSKIELAPERAGLNRILKLLAALDLELVVRPRGNLAAQKIRMAMAVPGKNRHYRWNEIHARHWLESARRCGFGEMTNVVEDALARTPAVIERVRNLVPPVFPSDIANSILQGVSARAKQLSAGLSA